MINASIAIALVTLTTPFMAHHSLAQFDTTTAVRVKGAIVLFKGMNPHSILFIDQKTANGKSERWALESPGVAMLRRMGLPDEMFKAGDTVEACGYVLKEGLDPLRTLSTEPISLSLKAITPKSMTGRLLAPEFLVLPDKQQRPWLDYGFHRCFGPDYRDVHNGR
jgi:hypothetical protein